MIDRLSDLALFKRIVELGSLSAAGRELGVSPATVSVRLQTLEAAVGRQLIQRTTRQMLLTEAGEQVFHTVRRILAEVDDLQDAMSKGGDALSGPIHVSAPVDLGRHRIAPAIDLFQERHPGISIRLSLTDSVVDLTQGGVDIAVRYGKLPDSSLRLRRISSNRRLPVASPDYLALHPAPETPDDLLDHDCIVLVRDGTRFDQWTFNVDGRLHIVRAVGSRETNDGGLIRHWARTGRGIAFKAAWDVVDDIRSGALVPLLTRFCPPTVDIQVVMPAMRYRPARTRALADHLVDTVRQLDSGLAAIDLASPMALDGGPPDPGPAA